jgi:hypothetical protein
MVRFFPKRLVYGGRAAVFSSSGSPAAGFRSSADERVTSLCLAKEK